MGKRAIIGRVFRRLAKRKERREDVGLENAVVHEPPPAPADEQEEAEMVDVEVDDAQLETWLNESDGSVLLDIREPMEVRGGYAKGALLIPMNSIPARIAELPGKETRLLVYCAAGVRSFGVTHWLREQGWSDSWSVTSGFSGVLRAGGELQRD